MPAGGVGLGRWRGAVRRTRKSSSPPLTQDADEATSAEIEQTGPNRHNVRTTPARSRTSVLRVEFAGAHYAKIHINQPISSHGITIRATASHAPKGSGGLGGDNCSFISVTDTQSACQPNPNQTTAAQLFCEIRPLALKMLRAQTVARTSEHRLTPDSVAESDLSKIHGDGSCAQLNHELSACTSDEERRNIRPGRLASGRGGDPWRTHASSPAPHLGCRPRGPGEE